MINPDFYIQKSILDVIFAPFINLADYFIAFEHYQFQILSWISWILYCGIILAIKKRNLNIIPKSFLLFWFLAIFVLFVRYPGNHLISKDPDQILVDYHSHTYYSWDGIASLDRSISYHKANGFDAFAITEHNLIYPKPIKETEPVIILGQEISKNGIFQLTLNDATVAALWWQHTSFDEMIKNPITAYEISNMGHRKIKPKLGQSNLPKIGVTDWHGWGFRANTWTAVKIPNWKKLTYKEKQTALVDALKGKYEVTVIEQKRNEIKNNLRYFFEPFFGLFYILNSQNFVGLLSWFIWALIAIYLVKFRFFWITTGSTILIFGVKFLITWNSISEYNKSLKTVAISFILIGLMSILVALKKER